MQIKDNKSLTVSIVSAVDAKNNPTALDKDAVPSWAVDNDSLAEIVPAADNMSAVVNLKGPLGTFNVQCSIPAVGDEAALQGSMPVEVIASEAVSIAITGTVN